MATSTFWNRNDIQFPRLLAEIQAVGLTEDQVRALCASMDLQPENITELFNRADLAWEEAQETICRTCGGPNEDGDGFDGECGVCADKTDESLRSKA